MILSGAMIWLALFLLIYGALALFWARQAAVLNRGAAGFFVADNGLPPWIVALVMAGASLSGWVVLGFPGMIATQGFGFATLGLAGVVLPLAGVLFFKRQWALGRRYGISTQGEMFSRYYGGRGLSVISALVALVFAIGFTGMQLRALGDVLAQASGGVLSAPVLIWAVALTVFAYVVIGGMRAIGYLGALQTVLIGLAIAGLAVFLLAASDGFVALNQRLAQIAQTDPARAANLFRVAGVVQFTAGIGVENPIGGQWSAVMILSTALALMGFQASPMATQLLLSTRSSAGLAAGQTWVMAGVFGALVAFGIVLIGAQGLAADDKDIIGGLLTRLGVVSPWFMAGVALGLVAAVQIVAGLSLLSAATTLVRDIYVPFFHRGLGAARAVLLTRILVGLLLLVSVLLALLAPVGLSVIGAIALPAAFQLWPALIGLCWFGWISRQAATAGATIGLVAVLVTDSLGGNILAFLGLDLPWGRWPWTIHSAAWGMFFNLSAVIVISAITRGRGHSPLARQMQAFLRQHAPVRTKSRALTPAAWSAVLAWFFLALGPGVVIGNQTFGPAAGGFDGWRVGMPSLWAWSLIFWVLGVFLIWFMSYRLELATAPTTEVLPAQEIPDLPITDTRMQERELVRLGWSVAVITGGIAMVTWIFG